MAGYLKGDRPHTPKTAGELETLTGFLDHYRATLALKCDGLTPAQLAQRSVPPSSLSLLGIVRHMGDVEQGWFQRVAGQPGVPRYSTAEDRDGDFDNVRGDQAQVDDAFEYWQAEIARARSIVSEHDLDDTFVHPHSQTVHSLRWVLVHMIEEYARHCGHADLLRECIDGVTGY